MHPSHLTNTVASATLVEGEVLEIGAIKNGLEVNANWSSSKDMAISAEAPTKKKRTTKK